MPKKPVQFTIPDGEIAELRAMATELGLTNSEVVRNALTLYLLLRKAVNDGAAIRVFPKDEEPYRLVRL